MGCVQIDEAADQIIFDDFAGELARAGNLSSEPSVDSLEGRISDVKKIALTSY